MADQCPQCRGELAADERLCFVCAISGDPGPDDDHQGDRDAPHPADDDHQGASDRTGAVLAELERLRVQREARRMLAAEERPAAAAPEILTLAQRLERPRPPVAWRVHGWQPAGSRVVLAAQYKAGKTTTTGNLVRSLVDGAPWLGRWSVERLTGRVAVLDLEMSARQLDSWLSDQGITHTDQVVPVPLRGAASSLDLLDPARLTWWADTLRAWDVQYLVLDCLRPALDALGLDESRDAGRYLVALDELLTTAGVPDALVVHHMGHSNERARGDSRIRDWPDAEWRLVRQGDDPGDPRYITAYGRDVEQAEARLSWDPDTRHLTIAGGSRQDAAVESAAEAVAALLATASDGMSQRSVINALIDDHPRAAILSALRSGADSGSLSVTKGPRGANLYSSAPVRQTAPRRTGAVVSECASAPIERRTHADTAPGASAPGVTAGADETGGCRRWLPDADRRCGDTPVGRWQIGPLCATHAPAVPAQPRPDSPSSGAASAVLGDDCGVDGCGQPRAGGSRTCPAHQESDIYAAAAV